jgi:hypothetical protein
VGLDLTHRGNYLGMIKDAAWHDAAHQEVVGFVDLGARLGAAHVEAGVVLAVDHAVGELFPAPGVTAAGFGRPGAAHELGGELVG